jgi:hypothetical protein
VEALL